MVRQITKNGPTPLFAATGTAVTNPLQNHLIIPNGPALQAALQAADHIAWFTALKARRW
jgi:hypothetical protein